MTRRRFRELVASLPADAPYFLAVFGSPLGRRPTTLAERQAAAESDPTFWWNLVLSYVQAGKPRPDLPWPEEILRLIRHLSDPNYYDPNLVQAEMFSLPENQRTRDIICALISCRGTTDESIANLFRCEVEVIRLFHLLFWHVRPFLNDPQYRLQLLEPGPDARAPGPGQMQGLLGYELLSRAIDTGDPTAVLAMAGVSLPGANPVSTEKLAEEIEREVTALTAQALAQGAEDPKQNRPLSLFLRYLQGRNREQPLQDEPLFGFQMTPADLQPSIDDLNARLALEQMAYQQGKSSPLPAPGALNPPAPENQKERPA